MNQERVDRLLLATLDDGKLSRGERTALGEVFSELDQTTASLIRSRVFAIARTELERRSAEHLFGWCEDLLHLLADRTFARLQGERDLSQEAWFAPEDVCHRRITQSIDGARRAIDVCVFTLTDDRIAAALIDAHKRNVAVRVLTDDEKAADLGSDITELARAGIAVRTDHSPTHMHHKFALFDGKTLITGSYNWTRSAGRENRENFIVTDDPVLFRRFRGEFDRLWTEFGR